MRELVLIAAAAAAIAGPALAGPAPAQTNSVTVKTASVDFADAAQVKRLYAHLTAVAIRVCSSETEELYGVRPAQSCVDQAVSAAVDHIDRPQLTAMLQSNRTTATAADDR